MKKILLFALPLLAMLAVSCEKDNGELSGNDIIEFKDPNFLKALLVVQDITYLTGEEGSLMDIDKNRDGKISVKEAQKVKALSLLTVETGETFNITSVPEIKYFTELKYFDCRFNQLTELDLSQNTSLTDLHCSDNQIATLNLSKNTALVFFECVDNQLTTLDLNNNIALTHLFCSDNQLTELDLSQNTSLTDLHCSDNQLTELDLSKNTALEYLDCRINPLEKIYLNVKNNLSQDTINQYKDIIEYVK